VGKGSLLRMGEDAKGRPLLGKGLTEEVTFVVRCFTQKVNGSEQVVSTITGNRKVQETVWLTPLEQFKKTCNRTFGAAFGLGQARAIRGRG
jgi:hypothetical protein